MSTEKHNFATEVQDLLHLLVHSLYSNKDIFLRELISNASDALDRARVETLKDSSLAHNDELHIRLIFDKEARTLAVSDNGIGMSRDELVDYIGTIARSGSRQILAAMKEKAAAGDDAAASPELIGQFGVGFYSSFMVAEQVTVVTRRLGEESATEWKSTGDGSYTLDDATRTSPGTTVTLSLRAVDEDDGLKDYSDQWVLQEVVKKHSDFVSHPIRMLVERQEPVLDDDGKPVEGAVPKLVPEDLTLNSMKAIWTRSKSDVTKEEYTEFYRHISGDWGEPLEAISVSMEGAFSAKMLFFIPKKAPFDLYYRDQITKGVQLYVKRVFIMDDWDALLPEWLRFVKGVIDSEDLSLNVSREILQQDRQVKAIRKFAVKKILDTLEKIGKDRPDEMTALWREFGPVIKEGLAHPDQPRERILNLLMCESTHDLKVAAEGDADSDAEVQAPLTTLGDYVERAADDQETIYYLTGSSADVLRASPHLEAFAAKKIEVLLFTDTIDEFWVQGAPEFKGKRFVSIAKGEVDLKDSDSTKDSDDASDDSDNDYFKDVCMALRAHLQDDVKEVRLSKRLTDSPACLVGDEQDMTPQLEQMMRRMGQSVPTAKRILEINGDHEFIGKLRAIHAADAKEPSIAMYARLLYSQAILAEGGTLSNPAATSQVLTDLMLKAVGADAGVQADAS